MTLNKKVAALSEQVLQDLDMTNQAHKLDFYPCIGNELQAIGNYRWKLLIGLPFYFRFNSVKNIDKNEILLFGQHAPNWKSEDGKEFLRNLVLSDKAKKYAIAEQIKRGMAWTNSFFFDVGPFFASIYSALIFFRQDFYYRKFKKSMRPPMRFAAAFGWAAVMYSVSLLLFSRLGELLGNESVKEFLEDIKNRQDYVEGGLEYYCKMQKRNQIMRNFFGTDGSFYYKANGNVVSYLSAANSITDMIEQLSQIDRFDQADDKKTSVSGVL